MDAFTDMSELYECLPWVPHAETRYVMYVMYNMSPMVELSSTNFTGQEPPIVSHLIDAADRVSNDEINELKIKNNISSRGSLTVR